MEKVKVISAAEARKRFAEITDEVRTTGVEYSVVRHGKEVARISPPRPSVPADREQQFEKAVRRFVEKYDDALADLANR